MEKESEGGGGIGFVFLMFVVALFHFGFVEVEAEEDVGADEVNVAADDGAEVESIGAHIAIVCVVGKVAPGAAECEVHCAIAEWECELDAALCGVAEVAVVRVEGAELSEEGESAHRREGECATIEVEGVAEYGSARKGGCACGGCGCAVGDGEAKGLRYGRGGDQSGGEEDGQYFHRGPFCGCAVWVVLRLRGKYWRLWGDLQGRRMRAVCDPVLIITWGGGTLFPIYENECGFFFDVEWRLVSSGGARGISADGLVVSPR